MDDTRRQSGFTLIELMISVAIIGILAATAIPAFVRYVKKAKSAETADLLRKMMEGARVYYLDTHLANNGMENSATSRMFPATVGATPAANCCTFGQKCPGDTTLWQNASWKALLFELKEAHYYRYSFRTTVGTPSTFTAVAEGDLDCDGDLSTHTLYGEGGANDVQSAADIVKVNALE